jgi:transposase
MKVKSMNAQVSNWSMEQRSGLRFFERTKQTLGDQSNANLEHLSQTAKRRTGSIKIVHLVVAKCRKLSCYFKRENLRQKTVKRSRGWSLNYPRPERTSQTELLTRETTKTVTSPRK